ncbi:dicarboxylate transporter/tellurite-resistance protein TehA [Ktedonobacteria bacterium brp13]|nr:dicarboxylate transporter/tellurite-resistance protein TehA [Ktedonobacteria bacterium brp13]
MPTFEHIAVQQVKRSRPHTLSSIFVAIPPGFFGISMGIVGLAAVWRWTAVLYGWPIGISNALYLIAALVYIVLVIALVTRIIFATRAVRSELTHSTVASFYSFFPISGMLLSFGLEPYAFGVARAFFIIFFVCTLLFGGWITGQWIEDESGTDAIHPGYLLPTVAGGLIGADGAARFGFIQWGWMSFGIGMICWLMLGSIILNHLFTHTRLPVALIPTLAIEIAPPAVAGDAYFTLTSQHIDILTYILGGYTILMALVQLRLFPLYHTLPFSPNLWALTFPYATTASYLLRWMYIERWQGAAIFCAVVVIAISLFIGGITLRSLIELRRGKILVDK